MELLLPTAQRPRTVQKIDNKNSNDNRNKENGGENSDSKKRQQVKKQETQ